MPLAASLSPCLSSLFSVHASTRTCLRAYVLKTPFQVTPRQLASQVMLNLIDLVQDDGCFMIASLIPVYSTESNEEYAEWVDSTFRIVDKAGGRYIGSGADGAAQVEARDQFM